MKILKTLSLVLLISVTACKDDDSASPTKDPNKLEGLYTTWNVDVLGYCGGLCWINHYFFEDGTVLYDVGSGKEVNWEKPVCAGEDCRTYKIEDGKILIEGEDPKDFSRTEDNKVKIGKSTYSYMEPVGDLKFNAVYRSFNYVSDPSNGTGAGIDIHLTLKPDGTYSERGFGFGYSDGVSAGGENEQHEGTYKIKNHLIEFTSDGGKEKLLFFLPEGRRNDINGSPGMIHIGSRDYLQED